MSRQIVKGSTDQSTIVRILNATTGVAETGVTSATGGLDLKYRREGAATVNLTESDLSALTDAHSDGGMLHIGAGYYRIDVPDAAFASGADGVLIFGSVTGMVVIGAYHELVAAKQTGDNYAIVNSGTHGNAALKTLIDDVEGKVDDLEGRLTAERAGYLDNLSAGAVALEATAQSIDGKTSNLPSDPADASDIAASFASIASTLSTLAGYIDTEVASILAAVDTEVAAIKAKTDSLTFTVAGQVDANVQAVNDVALTGSGTLGDEWGPA